jgi:hypothetical protein
VPEHRLAIGAVHVLAVDDRGGGALQVHPEQRAALDELAPAEILVASLQEVESVEARCSAAGAARSALKSGRPFLVVRQGLAVQHDSWRRPGGILSRVTEEPLGGLPLLNLVIGSVPYPDCSGSSDVAYVGEGYG